jgi:hypothetical protein
MKSAQLPTKFRAAPAAALLVLSPVIVEVLFGATHITMLYLLIPQICIYGGAALIIRTLARQRGWSAILLLGIAFAIAEECVILQTSVSPVLFGGDPNHIYSWKFGVNWVYLLWALIYESIWAILLPIQLVELIFPTQRDESWADNRGLAITAALFLLASVAVWYRFTQVGIVPGKAYDAPLPQVMIALAIVVALGFAAFALWKPLHRAKITAHRVPSPRMVGVAAFGMALPWFILPILAYVGPASLPAFIPIIIGLAWAIGSLFIINRWASNLAWQDTHRLAMITGALVASMLAGFLIVGPTLSPVDLIGKLALNGVAVILLIYLARKIRQHIVR